MPTQTRHPEVRELPDARQVREALSLLPVIDHGIVLGFAKIRYKSLGWDTTSPLVILRSPAGRVGWHQPTSETFGRLRVGESI